MPKKSTRPESLWQIQGVGEVSYKRNSRAKRLTISIRPSTGIKVTVPGLLPLSIAKKFVEEKKKWIKEKLDEISAGNKSSFIESGFKTRNHELRLIPVEHEQIKLFVNTGFIDLQHPKHLDFRTKNIQDAARVAIELAYRQEAHETLPDRVTLLAKKFGFTFNALRIKKTTSRWGSCSSKNNINLSIFLMKLPNDLVDYIILHELVHTIHKNHGPNFWNHLNRITGDAKGLAARVKKYNTGII